MRAKIIGIPTSQVAVQKGLVLAGPVSAAKKKALDVYGRGLRKEHSWPRLIFLKKGADRPRLKRYYENVKQGKVPTTWWSDEDYETPIELGPISCPHTESGHNQAGVNELDDIVGKGHGFDTVKPMKLFSKTIQLWCPPDDVVVDPFAGSGMTGHAVLQINTAAGAQRWFILVE
jgi:adenine-specific DNA-methyltransferase